MDSRKSLGWIRERDEGQAQVRPIELFFDLVYVLAVTQLAHRLTDHLSLRGVGEAMLLLLAVWVAWIYTGWFTNYFDPNTRPMRLALIGLMGASLIMSTSIPGAFGGGGLVFAISLVAIQVGRTAFVVAVVGDHRLSGTFRRALVWWSATGVLWLAGGLAQEEPRVVLWVAAVVAMYGGILVGFPVPGLGRSRTTDYTISGEHMAERCQLFVILALGESILGTGIDLGGSGRSAAAVAAFVVAFVASVALWWIYFDRGAEAGRRAISAASDPGRLAILAYSYFHIPMVAGIIGFAAAAELTILRPTEGATVALAALILGGFALFLVGSALFERTLWGHLPRSRLVAAGTLAALAPLAAFVSSLALLVAATLVVVAVALWDSRPGVAT